MNIKPTQPLAQVPSGYLSLERYSSLARFWDVLNAAEAKGLTITLQRGDNETVCRRKISGVTLSRAGRLLDVDKLLNDVYDGFVLADPLLQFLSGNPEPIRDYLSEHYVVQLDMVLAFSRMRELLIKYQAEYQPRGSEQIAQTRFYPKRFSRDELRFMLMGQIKSF